MVWKDVLSNLKVLKNESADAKLEFGLFILQSVIMVS
jgi:hypothetical protein